MILTAHQPLYLPWLGLFHKISLADQFCFFDIAQYQNKDFNNRNKIKTQSGPLLLSVPVESKDHFEKKICDIKILDNAWRRKHIKSIHLAYQKAPFFDKYFSDLEKILNDSKITFLADLDFQLLKYLMNALDIQVPIVKASDYHFKGEKSDLVLDMCVQLGAKIYIFGSQGKNYADVESFLKAGVHPYFQEYNHPVYSQLHGGFEPNLSVIDLLFNEGPKSKNIICQHNWTRDHFLGGEVQEAKGA